MKFIFPVLIIMFAMICPEVQCQTPADPNPEIEPRQSSQTTDSTSNGIEAALDQIYKEEFKSGNQNSSNKSDNDTAIKSSAATMTDTTDALVRTLSEIENDNKIKPDNPNPEAPNPNHTRLVVRCIFGGATVLAFLGGIYANSVANKKYNDYKGITTIGDHTQEYASVNNNKQYRNVLYEIAGVTLTVSLLTFVF